MNQQFKPYIQTSGFEANFGSEYEMVPSFSLYILLLFLSLQLTKNQKLPFFFPNVRFFPFVFIYFRDKAILMIPQQDAISRESLASEKVLTFVMSLLTTQQMIISPRSEN